MIVQSKKQVKMLATERVCLLTVEIYTLFTGFLKMQIFEKNKFLNQILIIRPELYLTLLMALGVNMEALENKNHGHAPTCAKCVIFQLPCLPIEPLGGLSSFWTKQVYKNRSSKIK